MLSLGFGDVCFNVANLDGATGRLPSGKRLVIVYKKNWEWGKYSWRTPTAQQVAGGLDAIVKK
jgi:hypothetical protein